MVLPVSVAEEQEENKNESRRRSSDRSCKTGESIIAVMASTRAIKELPNHTLATLPATGILLVVYTIVYLLTTFFCRGEPTPKPPCPGDQCIEVVVPKDQRVEGLGFRV